MSLFVVFNIRPLEKGSVQCTELLTQSLLELLSLQFICYEVKQKAAAQLHCWPREKTKHPMKNNEHILLDQRGSDASLPSHENLHSSYLVRYFLCPSE